MGCYCWILLDYGAKWANFLVEWLNDEVFVDKYPQENATQADYWRYIQDVNRYSTVMRHTLSFSLWMGLDQFWDETSEISEASQSQLTEWISSSIRVGSFPTQSLQVSSFRIITNIKRCMVSSCLLRIWATRISWLIVLFNYKLAILGYPYAQHTIYGVSMVYIHETLHASWRVAATLRFWAAHSGCPPRSCTPTYDVPQPGAEPTISQLGCDCSEHPIYPLVN